MTVTGEVPFRGRNSHDLPGIFKKKLEADLAPPRQLVPALSQRVNDAILQSLDADKKKRQASVKEFIDSLTENSVHVGNGTRNGGTRNGSSPARGSDRRAKNRYASRKSGTCDKLVGRSGQPWTGSVVDISQDGVCLQLNRRFERGALLTIRFEAGPDLQHSMIACVKWVKQATSKSWRVGCQFAQALSESELNSLRELT
jgi:hypothetical protein